MECFSRRFILKLKYNQYDVFVKHYNAPITIQHKDKKILCEGLLISSLPGKALRMHVESRGLPSHSTCILKAEPGKFEIKRHKRCILLISLQVCSLFKLAIMTLLSISVPIKCPQSHSKSEASC